jgi:hypothetical protein
MRFGPEGRGREHHGHEDQQPEQRIVTDFFDQGADCHVGLRRASEGPLRKLTMNGDFRLSRVAYGA